MELIDRLCQQRTDVEANIVREADRLIAALEAVKKEIAEDLHVNRFGVIQRNEIDSWMLLREELIEITKRASFEASL